MSMRTAGYTKTIVIVLSLLIIIPATVEAARRTSLGFIGGIGEPVGWWGGRWDMFQAGEINVRYEFSPGTGLLLLAGVGKSGFASLSSEEVFNESSHGEMYDEFREKTTILKGHQVGDLKQLTVGFGF